MAQLAQFNIARARWPLDDPRMEEFKTNIDRINALAARSDGYVWRLESDATVYDDPLMTWTLSVWRDAEALSRFAFRTLHRQFFQRRADWFPALDHAHLVLWEVPDGHRPDLAEAIARKAALDAEGPTDRAFGWERHPHLAALRQAMAHPTPQPA